MSSISDLESRVEKIEQRNKKVELDKAWETSLVRRVLILSLTYIVVLSYFFVIEVDKPFTNAIVPTIGFYLSTLTVAFAKKYWIKNR